MDKKIPGWVMIALAILAASPVGNTAKKVQAALVDGKINTPEFGEILAEAAKDAQALVVGDAPEEQLAVDITEALSKYFKLKFPPVA